MNDLISRLSEIRSKYNCFDETEEPYYRALSESIQLASAQPKSKNGHRNRYKMFRMANSFPRNRRLKGENKMLSVIVVLLCIDCAISVCNMSTLISYREAIVMLVNLLTEEEEGE